MTEERQQGEFAKILNERITERVCKYCQMNKHCELCEISRVFMIIDLTDEEMNKCYQTNPCLDCPMYDKEKHHCPRFCEVIRNALKEIKEDKSNSVRR